MTKFMIFPYTQNSEGATAIAKEMEGQRILRQGSSYVWKEGDVVINWGASDCPFKQALNFDNRAVLNKLSFFQRLNGTGLTPKYATSGAAAANTLEYPIFCRTKLKGRDGAGIVIADTMAQIVAADLYVEGVSKTSEYRVHVGRLPNGLSFKIGSQKKFHHNIEGTDPRIWAGESTNFVWTVNGTPVSIPAEVYAVVMKTFEKFPELTFGAFDVVYCSQSGKAYVLEINSAPTVTPETAKRYGAFFREHNQMLMVTPQPAPAPVATPAPVAAPAPVAPPVHQPVVTEAQMTNIILSVGDMNIPQLAALKDAVKAAFAEIMDDFS